jgi:hypothetical protein
MKSSSLLLGMKTKSTKSLTKPGRNFDDFSDVFSLSGVSETEYFVGRETELAEMHKTLSGNGSRRVGVLHGPGGIGKTPTKGWVREAVQR